jgi:6-phosphogluconolactonase (cycloisomerase 2 family)
MSRLNLAAALAALFLVGFSAGPAADGQASNPFSPTKESESPKQSLYASTGAILTQYDVNVKEATLTSLSSVTLPRNVQYAWPDPSHRVLYVAWSAGTNDRVLGEQGISSFRIDKKSGALTEFGSRILLRKRPVHLSTDPNGEFLLVAHNNPPAGLTVWQINEDGSLGANVPEPGVVDGGIYAHQVMVDPAGHMAILVTRGNVPAEAPSGVEEPGALKVFRYENGVLSDEVSITVNAGFGFKPRHVDFYKRFVYLAVERQNQLMVYEKLTDEMLSPLPIFTKNTLGDQVHNNETIFPAQMVGPIHVSHDGRFVYVGNRNNGVTPASAGSIFLGGENTVAVFSVNKTTGEPTLIQTADTHGFVPRTLTFDKTGKILIAANQSAVNVRNADGTITRIPTSLAVFRIRNDGTLEYVRKYDNTGGTWAGMLSAP